MPTDSPTTSPPLLDSAHLRQLARLAAEAVAVGLLVSFVLGLAAFIVATTAQAAALEAAPGGELRMLQGPGEAPVPAPLIATDDTSLVAVDVTPTAPVGAAITTTAIPVNLPHGQDYDAIFGGLPQTATPAALHRLLGAIALAAALMLWTLAPRRPPCKATDGRVR